jgi:hypothetical protein
MARETRKDLYELHIRLCTALGRRAAVHSEIEIGTWNLNYTQNAGYVIHEIMEHGAVREPFGSRRRTIGEMCDVLRFAIQTASYAREPLNEVREIINQGSGSASEDLGEIASIVMSDDEPTEDTPELESAGVVSRGEVVWSYEKMTEARARQLAQEDFNELVTIANATPVRPHGTECLMDGSQYSPSARAMRGGSQVWEAWQNMPPGSGLVETWAAYAEEIDQLINNYRAADTSATPDAHMMWDEGCIMLCAPDPLD